MDRTVEERVCETEHKLNVLAEMAQVLNERQIVWAVGGSLLLFLKGKTQEFHDLDLMVLEQDVDRAKKLLEKMGTQAPPNPDVQYRTRHFLEFTIQDVEVDVMAGFVIVKDGTAYDCSLLPEQIVEQLEVNGQKIPLQSLEDWRRYYDLMGRASKVTMIDSTASSR